MRPIVCVLLTAAALVATAAAPPAAAPPAAAPPAAAPAAAAPPAAAPPSVARPAVPDAVAAYWPAWRGPGGQGVPADEKAGYVDRWSATENVLWKVELPGRGNSSPIVVGDRVVLTTATNDGRTRSLLCLHRADGRKLWETAAPEVESPEKPGFKNNHASSTPASDGQRVVVYLGSAGVFCVELATGAPQWRTVLGAINTRHGPAGSVLLLEGRVYLYQDQNGKDASFVAALDGATGKLLWRTARKGKVGWGTPNLVRVRVADGAAGGAARDDAARSDAVRDELIVSGQDRVIAYNAATGEELWSCGGNLEEVTPTPVIGHGLVFCCSGRAGPTLAIRPGGSGDVTETRVAWRSVKGSPFVPSPVIYGGRLFMVNDMAGVATCYDAVSGKLIWQGRLCAAAKEGFTSSPVAVAGRVYFTNDEGSTFVVDATGESFSLLHTNTFGERILASPALSEGRWYWRTDRHLYCVAEERR